MMLLSGLGLNYVIEDTPKAGVTTAPQTKESLASDHLRVCSLLTARVHEDNYSLINSQRTNAATMFQTLKAHHQNRSAGGQYLYMRQMMLLNTSEDVEDVLKMMLQLDTLRSKLTAICTQGNISIDDFYVASVISSLPEAWAGCTRHLESQTIISVTDIKNAVRAEATKRRNRDTLSSVTTVASASVASTPLTPSNSSGYKGSHPLCNNCARHHPGKCNKSKTVEKSEIDQLKFEISKLKGGRIRKPTRPLGQNRCPPMMNLRNLTMRKPLLKLLASALHTRLPRLPRFPHLTWFLMPIPVVLIPWSNPEVSCQTANLSIIVLFNWPMTR